MKGFIFLSFIMSMIVTIILSYYHIINTAALYIHDNIIHDYLIIFNLILFFISLFLNLYFSYKYKLKRRIYISRLCHDLRYIFESLPIGVFIIDDNHLIKFMNHEAIKLLKLGKNYVNLKCSAICNKMCNLNNITSPIQFEHSLELNNVNLSSTLIPISLDDGKLYIEFLYDATYHQKELNELIKTCNFKSDLISIVSHEFRSPLYSMKLSLSSILDGYSGILDNEVKEDVEIAYSGVIRLIELINDILDTSKLDNNKFEYVFEYGDLAFIITSIVDFSKHLLKYNNIKCNVNLEDNLYTMFDKQRMLQVFTNLMSNAIKFTHANGKIIINATKNDTNIIIEFIDDGIGIDPKTGNNIFSKFFHLTNNELNLSGIGLGLYIVKNIIMAHGGNIEYKSPVFENRGTKFIITLPLDKDHYGNIKNTHC